MDCAIINNNSLPNNYSKEMLLLEKGKGVYIEDSKGNKYLDFGSGIAVNSLGYGNKDIEDAACSQIKKLMHVSNLYATKPGLELSEKLTGTGNFAAVHFGSSGTEANEAALKYARLYAHKKHGENKYKVLCFTNGFHGRTMGSLSVTANDKYQKHFKPLIPGIEVCEYNNSSELDKMLDDSFAAVIVEVVQGEGGLTKMTAEFAEKLNSLCSKHDIILIADEVQTGLLRCGEIYASSIVNLHPDIITLAKPLAAGLPLSATLIPAKINDLLEIGDHGTTFGGGPVTTAVASKVLDILFDPEFMIELQSKSAYFTEQLNKLVSEFDFLVSVKGTGFLLGLEYDEKINAADIIKSAMNKGLLILRSGKNVIRIAPPFIISQKEIDEGINILKKVFMEISNS